VKPSDRYRRSHDANRDFFMVALVMALFVALLLIGCHPTFQVVMDSTAEDVVSWREKITERVNTQEKRVTTLEEMFDARK